GEAMRLVILGEGPERARLEALRARLGLEGSVELPGHCDDVVSWLGQADCFVLSSDYEGLPGVVVEALAAGLPVVSTDSTVGLRALVEDGRDGWIVPVRDARALTDAMGRVRELPADRQTMRARALRFSLENSAPLYLDKLRDLALSAA
ncbi:MAG: glycosyltransferase, partial [Novosphingobium sp.]|nr:glycosyltransferase [Novosphingobium sp.]